MARTQFLQYVIHLTDADRVAELQGITDPGSNQAVGAIIRAPYNAGPPAGGAAVEFEAPILAAAAPFVAPCITSPWFNTEANFPINVATFTRKSGGWFGIPLLFGETTRFYWRGVFQYSPPGGSEIDGETPVAMAQRRWIDGFELPDLGDGGSGNNGHKTGRAYSRHVDGMGARFDNDTNTRTHAPAETRGGANPRQMWERFYIRPRVLGAAGQSYVHKINGATSASAGVRLSLIPSGQILIENIDGAGAATALATVDGPALHAWARIDVLWRYNQGGAPAASYQLFVNGVSKFTYAGSGAAGINQSQLCQSSTMGGGSPASHGFHHDVDDWIGADWPTGGSSASILPGVDWNNGSRVVQIVGASAAATNGTWAGNLQALGMRPITQSAVTMTSATAVDRLAVVTDAASRIDRVEKSLGMIALNIARYGRRAVAALSGQLGYKLPGQAEVLQAVVEADTNGWVNAMYQPSGLTTPLTAMSGLEISHVKGNDAGASTLYALQATAELLGKFYQEDNPPTSQPPTNAEPLGRMIPHHNGPYPDTPWAQPGPPPISGVVVAGGTYVGNGTTQDLTFTMPIHLLMIRNVTTPTTAPLLWMASGNGPHPAGQRQQFTEGPVRVFKNPSFAPPANEDDQSLQIIARITGAIVNSNQAGQTYQYIAFGDAGLRFSLGDGLSSLMAASSPMGATGWTPEAALVQLEDSGATATVLAYFKGVGATGALLGRFAASSAHADGLTFGANTLTVGADLAAETAVLAHASYLAFRRADGNNSPSQARVLQLASWVGDGTASRTISLAPASGRRPMFALVVPHNATTAYQRDPSHTGTTSFQHPATNNAATGITGGGVDQVSVGSALNANGVIFDMLVFPGCDGGVGNNGWSINCVEYPVEPEAPIGGPWGEEPDPPGEVPDDPDEPPSDEEGLFDFSEDCVDASTLIINKALSYIGVSKQVGNILTEASLEAVTARLHYSDDVSATLRDYPWSFATRYEDLALVRGNATDIDLVQTYSNTRAYTVGDTVEFAGSAWYCIAASTGNTPTEGAFWTAEFQQDANGDWAYAYRVPSRMMFARRIVNPDGSKRDFDPNPIKFRVGSDAYGGLIYTDEANPELEYTLRLSCVAASGDTIFRKALTWRHASSLAPAVARDDKKLQTCLAMYATTLAEARSRDAQEQQQAPDGDSDWIRGRE